MTKRGYGTLALCALAALALPAVAQQQRDARDERKLTFTFRRASIQTFMGYLSREAGFSFLEEAAIQGDITAIAEQPVSRDEALALFQAWLLPKGRTLLRNADVIRIVTLEEAKRRGLPVRIGAAPEDIKDSDDLITQVMPLRYVKAEDVKREMEGLLSDQGRMMIEGTSNALVVSDTSASIRRLAEVLAALDKAVTAELHVKVYRLQNARADEVSTVIQRLFSDAPVPGASGGGQGGGGQGGGGRGGRGGGGQGGQGGGGMRDMARMFFAGGGQGGGGSGASTGAVNVAPDPRTNSVVVTASTDQIRLVDQLVAELDREPDPVVTAFRTFTLENADAGELASTLTTLFEEPTTSSSQGGNQDNVPRWVRRMVGGGGPGGGPGGGQGGGDDSSSGADARYAPKPRFTSDARTNSLIVSATQTDMAMIAQLVVDLDKNPSEKTGLLVVPLRNATAESLATVLAGVLTEQSSTAQNAAGGAGAQGAGRQRGGFGGGNADSSSSSSSGSNGLVGEVTVVPDTESNALVFTSSPKNFDRLRGLVDELDKPRREVFIEVLMAEVQLNDKGELGIQWNTAFSNSIENAQEGTQSLGTDFGLDALRDGLVYTTTSDKLTGLLRALKTEGRLNVLSTPKILVMENSDAEISVGQQVPYITNSRITQNGDTVNTVQYRDVGIILRVTPQINKDGFVRLVVHPEVSSIAPDSQSVPISEGVRSPTFNRNFADSTIVVRTGETAVVGGMIRDSFSETVFKIPFLGDLPIVGRLFSSMSREKVKQELVVFLTPHVIEDPGQLRERTRQAWADYALLPPEVVRAEMDRWLTGLDDEQHAWHYNRGTILLEAGRANEAVPVLQEAARLAPSDCATRLNLGLALTRSGELDQAVSQLEVAGALDPGDPEIPYARGAVHWRRGDYVQAVRAFRLALLVDPSHGASRHWLPLALEAQERLERGMLEQKEQR